MPEVETTEVVESPDAPSPEAAPEVTPDVESLATLKARLAGKDRAFTALKSEAEQSKALIAELSRWKAEKEASEMTEVERLSAQVTALEAERDAASAAAARIALQRDFPLAFAFIGDDAAPALGEAKLAEIETRLKTQAAPAEPPVNPNNPPKLPRTGVPLRDETEEALLARLRAFGNPFTTQME